MRWEVQSLSVQVKSERLDRTFAALADPTRRAIIGRLSQGETTVGALARPLSVSLPAVSKHVRVLEEAGIVRRERRGRHQYCRLDARPMSRASDWISHHAAMWQGQLSQLEAFLRETRS